MDYNDFPILSNETYKFLEKQFLAPSKKTNRVFYFNNITNSIQTCLSYCYGIDIRTYAKLNKEIEKIKIEFETILQNLNFSKSSEKINITTYNHFSLIKEITFCLSTHFQWLKTEEKEYYKKIADANINILFKILSVLISALEKQNFYLFKYM